MRRTYTKWLGAVLLVGISLGATAAETGWLTDFEEAKKIAAEKKRPILIDFSGSDWCGWCIRLDREVFSKAEFKAYADKNLVLLLADFPNGKELPEKTVEQNRSLARKYGVQGFPTVLLLGADGETKGRTGYQEGGAGAYVEHLKTLLKEGGKG
ncbi:MAG: thioredoxin family protein [Lentisphaerae bacterium]|nr:thioredoxin family protein [Lentisphaerota bacterium]MBT4821643.1 thioredoxin family protein [Lentisphaerota bacterium]MBT5611001.1 thioredoxin family protein [Lentisphaerota bacterium]MBT7061529.1 thioredoxin family protein [Lentisphaerota bacterium]MBT7845598.1 thioredoxin family protein [Lentisphaerota bacterium]